MKKFVLLLVLLAAGAGGWYWISHRAASAGDEAGESAAVARVATVPLQRETLAQTVEGFGTVDAAPSSDIATSAPFDCLVRAVHVGVGARVVAGQVLLEVAPSPDAILALASARTGLTLADKTLTATQQRYELKLATSQDLVAAEQVADDARAKLASLTARGVAGDGKISASAAGVVSKLELTPGTLVPAGTLLVSVASADHLEARLGVEIGRLVEVRAGQPASLVSANRPELRAVASTVRAAGASIDAALGTAEVRVTVPPDAPFYFGEHVHGAIVVRQSDGLVAPRSAVLPDGEQHVLFTVKNGQAIRHEVKIGISDGDRVEVSGPDLRAGDSVVTLGNYELEDGMAVQTDENPPQGQPSAAAGGTLEARP